MDMDALRSFFFWCMVVNTGVYALTAIAVLMLRGLVCRVLEKMFRLDEEAALRSMQTYLANYKLLITAFNFAPWIALLIIA